MVDTIKLQDFDKVIEIEHDFLQAFPTLYQVGIDHETGEPKVYQVQYDISAWINKRLFKLLSTIK